MTVNFQFDRLNKTYFAGETVKCKAILQIKDQLSLNSMTIIYQGLGKTSWTGNSTTVGDEELHECCGSVEQYFSESFICFQSFNQKTFYADKYEYNTEFKLPNVLPTSFCGKNGQVIYKIRMVITSHLVNTILKEDEEEFFVKSVVNLNQYPFLKTPIVKCKSKKIGILWFKSEYITLTTSISKKGFAIGEIIPLLIHVTNQSSVDIIFIEINLMEQIISKEKRRAIKKIEENIIWKKCIGGVLKCQNRLYDVRIPVDQDLMILLLDGADIITAKYSVVVKAVTKQLQTCIQTKIDLIFGTVSIQ